MAGKTDRADQESLERQAKRLRTSPIGNKEPWRLLWKGLARTDWRFRKTVRLRQAGLWTLRVKS